MPEQLSQEIINMLNKKVNWDILYFVNEKITSTDILIKK